MSCKRHLQVLHPPSHRHLLEVRCWKRHHLQRPLQHVPYSLLVCSPVLFEPEYSLLTNVLILGSRLSLFPLSELQTWQLAMSDHYDVSRPDVLFKGDSPDDVARGLLAALSHIVEFQDPDVRPPFQLPPGIQRALLRSVCDLFCTSLGCVSFCAYVVLTYPCLVDG